MFAAVRPDAWDLPLFVHVLGAVDDEWSWIGIGYITSDVGLLLTLIAIGLAWRASRRGTAARAVMVLAAVLLLAFAVAVWAMTTKPE